MGQHGTARKADDNGKGINANGGDDAPASLADERHSEGTRQTYRRAVRGFDEWLGGRPETDAELAAHLDRMFAEGLSPSYAGVVVAAVADESDAGPSPAGELTARALAARRRRGSAAAPRARSPTAVGRRARVVPD